MSFRNIAPNNQKRYSFNSKENKKGLSQFNLNGLITLGGNSLFNSKKNSIQESSWKKPSLRNQNLTMNSLKKNFSQKQKVFYSSMNQYNLKMNNQYSNSQKYFIKKDIFTQKTNKKFLMF